MSRFINYSLLRNQAEQMQDEEEPKIVPNIHKSSYQRFREETKVGLKKFWINPETNKIEGEIHLYPKDRQVPNKPVFINEEPKPIQKPKPETELITDARLKGFLIREFDELYKALCGEIEKSINKFWVRDAMEGKQYIEIEYPEVPERNVSWVSYMTFNFFNQIDIFMRQFTGFLTDVYQEISGDYSKESYYSEFLIDIRGFNVLEDASVYLSKAIIKMKDWLLANMLTYNLNPHLVDLIIWILWIIYWRINSEAIKKSKRSKEKYWMKHLKFFEFDMLDWFSKEEHQIVLDKIRLKQLEFVKNNKSKCLNH